MTGSWATIPKTTPGRNSTNSTSLQRSGLPTISGRLRYQKNGRELVTLELKRTGWKNRAGEIATRPRRANSSRPAHMTQVPGQSPSMHRVRGDMPKGIPSALSLSPTDHRCHWPRIEPGPASWTQTVASFRRAARYSATVARPSTKRLAASSSSGERSRCASCIISRKISGT